MENEISDNKHNFDTLAISGGGVKGFILLGAIQAALDKNLLDNINTYIGTSMGSIISYLLIIGYTPIEIVVALNTKLNHYLEKTSTFDIMNIYHGNGATTFNHINEGLEKLTIDKIGQFLTLGKLKEQYGKTLICVSYNMTQCKPEYIGPDNYPDIPCLTAIRMSSNIPMVFDRFKYMDCYYIDGGVSDNFPILKACELGKNVLGICLDIEEHTLRDDPKDGMLSYFFRLMQIPVVQGTRTQIQLAEKKNCFIVQIVSEMKTFVQFSINSKLKLDMFSQGYETAKNKFLKL